MFKALRIIFCVLAVLCAAVTIFIFVYFTLWGLIPLLAAIAFGALMILFKNMQEKDDLKKNPPPPKGDFITGKVKSEPQDDQNK